MPWIMGSRCPVSHLYPACCRCSQGAWDWACLCMPNNVYYICMYIAIVFILLMEYQPEISMWSLAGLWLDGPTPAGRNRKTLHNCLYVAMVVLF